MPARGPAGGVRRFAKEYQRTWRSTGPAGRGFLLGGIVYLIRTFGFVVAFPLFAKERGYGPGEIGTFLAASQFSLFLLAIPITILGGRGHARQLLRIGPGLAGFGLILILLAPDGSRLLVTAGALFAGAGGATFWILGDPLLAATTPPAERAHVYALKFFVVTIGVSLGGGIGGWIPGFVDAAGASTLNAFRWTLAFFVALDLLQAYMFSRIPPYEPVKPKPVSNRRSSPRTFSRSELTPWLVMIALSVPEIGMAFGHNSVRPFLSLFFSESHGLSASTTGTTLSILGLAAGFGSLAAPRIAGRLGNIPAIAVMRVVSAAAIFLWFARIGLPPVLALMVLYYVIMDGTEAIFITEAIHRLPVTRWTWFSGIYAMAWSISSSAASLVSGSVQDHYDGAFGVAFSLGAFGYLFSVAWMIFVLPRLPSLKAEAPEPIPVPV